MKKKILKNIMAMAIVAATFVGSVSPAMAAEGTQEVTGSDTQQKQVEISADVKSVYSVSLPATITLTYGTVEKLSLVGSGKENDSCDGYWATIKYGVAGKISSNEKVNVVPQFPCTMTLLDDEGQPTSTTVQMLNVLRYDSSLDKVVCNKTAWSKSDIGSCDYDGITISNCNYAYCCDGHNIGIRASDIEKSGTYEGNLTFEISITKD